MHWLAHGNLPDGSTVDHSFTGDSYTKEWIVENCGLASWSGVVAVRVSGPWGPFAFDVGAVPPDTTATISASMQTPVPPPQPAQRVTYQLEDPLGNPFGDLFWTEVASVAT